MRNITTLAFTSLLALFLIGIKANAEQAAPPKVNLAEQNTMSVLWFQTSGEAKALYYQGYNIGKQRLDEFLTTRSKTKQSGLKPAVVLDIDETIIDNSPLFAGNIKNSQERAMSWNGWVKLARAKALPGALQFLKYADSKGVEIYYISNRDDINKAATIENLKKVGAPRADVDHVLLQKPDEIGKESRRVQVAKTHEIILLFGDNLGDFGAFDQLSAEERGKKVDNKKEEFGRKWIILPNPMYGDWEGAVYNNTKHLSDSQKAKLRKDNLQP